MYISYIYIYNIDIYICYIYMHTSGYIYIYICPDVAVKAVKEETAGHKV